MAFFSILSSDAPVALEYNCRTLAMHFLLQNNWTTSRRRQRLSSRCRIQSRREISVVLNDIRAHSLENSKHFLVQLDLTSSENAKCSHRRKSILFFYVSFFDRLTLAQIRFKRQGRPWLAVIFEFQRSQSLMTSAMSLLSNYTLTFGDRSFVKMSFVWRACSRCRWCWLNKM